MDMKKLLSIVDNSGTKEKTVITEGKNMAMDMVMNQYSKPQQTAPKFKSRINEYFKVVDNEMLNVLKEEQEQKKIEVKKIVNRVLTRMDESKTVKATAPKPRNFVAKNATTSGAGSHKDKKKAEKQGDVKHKAKVFDEGAQLDEISLGDYRKKAAMQKAQSQMGAMFAKEPADREKNLATFNKREKGLNRLKSRDEKSRKAQQDKQIADLVARLPELKAEYAQMKDEYKSLGGSDWQYADREQNLSPGERKARDMEGPMNNLWRQIQSAEKAQGIAESTYGSVEVGAPVKVYSNVLKKSVFGKVVKLQEGRAYVQYDNTKIVMGHPIETVQLNEAATVAPAPTGAMGALKAVGQKAARFVPGLGLVAGGVDAYDRIKKGDYTGAALSAGAGLASFVPVVGTAAAMGLTAAQLGRDKARTGSFLPSEEEQLAAAAKDKKAAAPGQTATPAPGAMTPNPKTPATAAAAPAIKDPVALQKELLAVGADLGPTGADGKIGKFTKAAMADPKYAEIVKKYTTAPGQAATPGPGGKIASAVTAALPVAGAAARQALTK